MQHWRGRFRLQRAQDHARSAAGSGHSRGRAGEPADGDVVDVAVKRCGAAEHWHHHGGSSSRCWALCIGQVAAGRHRLLKAVELVFGGWVDAGDEHREGPLNGALEGARGLPDPGHAIRSERRLRIALKRRGHEAIRIHRWAHGDAASVRKLFFGSDLPCAELDGSERIRGDVDVAVVLGGVLRETVVGREARRHREDSGPGCACNGCDVDGQCRRLQHVADDRKWGRHANTGQMRDALVLTDADPPSRPRQVVELHEMLTAAGCLRRTGGKHEQVVRAAPVVADDTVDPCKADIHRRGEQAERHCRNEHPRSERHGAATRESDLAQQQPNHRTRSIAAK